jgi:hypothetical protein
MFGIKFKKQIAPTQTPSDNSTHPQNACPPPLPSRKSGSYSSQNPIKEAKKRNAKRKAQRKARKLARKKS